MDARNLAIILKAGKVNRLTQAMDGQVAIALEEGWDLIGWEVQQVPGARLYTHYAGDPDAHADERFALAKEARVCREMSESDADLAAHDADGLGDFYHERGQDTARAAVAAEARLAALPPAPDRTPIDGVLCVNADEQPHDDPYRVMVHEDDIIVLYRTDWLAASDLPVQPSETPF